MPIIFEYFGIILCFYSNDHEPIHVHAYYGDKYAMKVTFEVNNNKVVKREFSGVKNYRHLPPAQLRDLKKLISKYENEIVEDWITFAIRKQKVKKKVITKRLK